MKQSPTQQEPGDTTKASPHNGGNGGESHRPSPCFSYLSPIQHHNFDLYYIYVYRAIFLACDWAAADTPGFDLDCIS